MGGEGALLPAGGQGPVIVAQDAWAGLSGLSKWQEVL